MDPFTIGRLIGELGRDVRILKVGQAKLKAEVQFLRRGMLLLAIWGTAINGVTNSDQISDLLVTVLRKTLGL